MNLMPDNRVKELATRISDRAVCAVTCGNRDILDSALEWGELASRDGHPIELPILLDAAVILGAVHGRRNGVRWRSDDRYEAAREYGDWIRGMCRQARDYVGIGAGNNRSILPYLMHVSPRPTDGRPVEVWSKAYGLLRESEELRHKILSAWRPGSRSSRDQWAWWKKSRLTEDASPSGLWSRFSGVAGLEWLHESVDHIAAEVYLRSKGTKPTLSQSLLIQRLLKRRREMVSHPMTTSYTEQDPYHGATTLATLAMGDYGLFKIANRSAVWISEPPSTKPPRPMNIHLCWTHAYPGLCDKSALALPLPLPPDGWNGNSEEIKLGPAVDCSHASILQGIVALLIDDWRSALRKLPLHYHLYRGPSADKGLPLGKGGPRWRNPCCFSSLPPSNAVEYLFHRPSHVDLANKAEWELPARATDSRANWWCGCALLSDLRELGFERRRDTIVGYKDRGYWAGPLQCLHRCISHLIVVDPGESLRWSICRVQQRGHCELRPMRGWAETEGESYPFKKLRINALDLVLTVLKSRL